MCEVCYCNPCSPSCPNSDDEPMVVTKCELCGADIVEGEEYYHLNNMDVCDACVYEGRRTAEVGL